LLLTQPTVGSRFGSEASERDFTSPVRRELLRLATSKVGSDQPVVRSKVAEQLSPEALTLLTELTVGEEAVPEDLTARAEEVFIRLRAFSLARQIRARRDVLQDVNPVDDPERHDALFTELVSLEASRRDLLRRLQGAS
jgi:hypothetical protein